MTNRIVSINRVNLPISLSFPLRAIFVIIRLAVIFQQNVLYTQFLFSPFERLENS